MTDGNAETQTAETSVAFVYATYPDADTAREAAAALLNANLIACANIIPGMIAVYRWQGDVETASEVAVIYKTVQAKAETLVLRIRDLHPYEEPAVVVLPTIGGSSSFLDWVRAEAGGE